MAVYHFLGIACTTPLQLLLILIQIACYVNSYYLHVFLLGPLSLPLIFLLTLLYSRPLTALLYANSTHTHTPIPQKNITQYCKRCACLITHRDHHCVFTGRCVQKCNYKYFFSYILYSYALSLHTVLTLARYYPLLTHLFELQVKDAAVIFVAAVSSIYFTIFAGGLIGSSGRSIALGIYTVDQLKGREKPAYTNSQLRRMWLSKQGRKQLWTMFSTNWTKMVGQDATIIQILLVL